MSSAGPTSEFPSFDFDDFRSSLSEEIQLTSRSYDSLQSFQPSTTSSNILDFRGPQYDLGTYESMESLYREARHLRPVYDNLYDYEAYGDDEEEDEFIRRLKAFYRRHRAIFVLFEFMLQFGLCTLAFSL